MGGRNIPHLYIYKKKYMKIEKKIIKETVNDFSRSEKTFSSKKQNIIITEEQLQKLLLIVKK
jgi:hypothetical protein